MRILRKVIYSLLVIVVVLGVAIVIGRMIWPLPEKSADDSDNAIPVSVDTRMGGRVAERLRTDPEQSGVLPLPTGQQALASRLALIEDAESSIDLQYYIWHDDVSGNLLIDALQKASERGVRVRLLVDDNGIDGLDNKLLDLDALPGFYVRLFNPSTIRWPKRLGFAIDFFRMNRRMHNKALIVDGAVAIVGGRNIGDEYFSIGEENHFLDLDVIAAGAIVPATAKNFDAYWGSPSVYPIRDIVRKPRKARGGRVADLDDSWLSEMPTPAESLAGQFGDGKAALEWTRVQLVSDDPVKGLGQASGEQLMINQLGKIAGKVERQLDLISAYFIPGKEGVEYFTRVREQGAGVSILTNALVTTDVAMVHSGYSKYRKDLLRAGIELYELKPGTTEVAAINRQGLSIVGSSGASLHAKTLQLDDNRVFIGSFNMDPRSIHLNCEMGFLIESPTIAGTFRKAMARDVIQQAYKVELAGDKLRWIEQDENGNEVIHDVEPDTTAFERAMVAFFGLLPIEWAL